MSRRQWGHGYYAGINNALENQGECMGLYFYIIRNGLLKTAGRIVRKINDRGAHLAMVFDWLGGWGDEIIINPIDAGVRIFSDKKLFESHLSDAIEQTNRAIKREHNNASTSTD